VGLGFILWDSEPIVASDIRGMMRFIKIGTQGVRILRKIAASAAAAVVLVVAWGGYSFMEAAAQPAEQETRGAERKNPGNEPSLRAQIAQLDKTGQYEKSAELRQQLVNVLDGEAKVRVYLELGQIARDKLKDPYKAIDAFGGALKEQPDALEVMDSLYVLLRETRQGQKAADVLQRMLGVRIASTRASHASFHQCDGLASSGPGSAPLERATACFPEDFHLLSTPMLGAPA
jgi:tetratricopeptide (TPR) repeat protein